MTPLLKIEQLTMRFGGVTAIDGLSLQAEAGAITSLIGPNGAGKTTVFNCLTGFYKPTSGAITLHGATGAHHIERMQGHKINSIAKVARTFQNIRLFPRMTVLENLLVAQHDALHRNWRVVVGGLWNSDAFRQTEREATVVAIDWLDRLRLTAMADEPAGSLAYGDQRRLEIARAMCTQPRLLCLDEPAAGLNGRESAELGELLTNICKETGVGIVLIEHDMSVVMDISQQIFVLDYGKLIASGTPSQVKSDPAVIRAYLGAEDDEELAPEVATDMDEATR